MKKPIFYHQYPPYLLRFPRLIHLGFMWNNMTQLRKWHTMRAIKKEMVVLKKTIYLDIGCGEGQFLIPIAQKYPLSKCIGLDKNQEHVSFLNRYKEVSELTNIYTLNCDIEKELPTENNISLINTIDLALCIGVLQYVPNDRLFLRNMASVLKQNGKALLYVPVEHDYLTSVYHKIITKYEHYEKAQNRQRLYSIDEILTKLKETPFRILNIEKTVGVYGKLAHELYNGTLILLGNVFILYKILLLILFPIFILPLVYCLMLIDFKQKDKKRHFGLLITVEKEIAEL